jgi:hypothetical protein
VSAETRNPYFEAVEATTTQEASEHFRRLLREAVSVDPTTPVDHTKERDVASLCYVAGYYGDDTLKRVARLYSWRSPYRPPTP